MVNGEPLGDAPEQTQVSRQQVALDHAGPCSVGPKESTAGKKCPPGKGCCSFQVDMEGLKASSSKEGCREPSPAGFCVR